MKVMTRELVGQRQTLSDGTQLHYVSDGQGLPTFVPCLGSSIPYERTFGDELKKDHRFVFVEARGTSRSGGEFDSSIERMADDLEDLRQRLGLPRIAVLGQSRNGFIAAKYAQKYPQVVSHAVLVGTPLKMKDITQPEYWEAHADETRRQVYADNLRQMEDEGVNVDTPEGLIRWFNVESPRLWYDPYFDMTPYWEASLLDPSVKRRTEVEWDLFDLRSTLIETTLPVFVAWGKYDFHVSPTTLLDDVPGVQVEVFERSGHFPYFEEECEFAARYRTWVRGAGLLA